MGKGRIQHGLIEAIGGERFYLLHRKTEQPCFQIHRISMCGQLQAQLGRQSRGKVSLSCRSVPSFTRRLNTGLCQATVVFLPAYSPDFNPIEKMWSKVKQILRGIKPRTEEELFVATATALNAVTADDAQGWFDTCGYTEKKR